MLNLQQISKTEAIRLPTLLKAIADNRVFKKAEYRESFVKNINNLLGLRESRQTALTTLNLFCDHHCVAPGVITEKTCLETHWIEQLLRIIDQETQHHSECFEILTKLIKITSTNPDTNKFVQSKHIQKIIEAIIGSRVAPLESLTCLATCFEVHGGTSGIYKNKIYDYCASFIDLPDDQIAERAALCLHLLQQSRGGSVAGGVYKKCWAEFHERNLGSLEDVLEQIVKKGGGGKIGKSEQLQLPELVLSHEPFNMYTQLFVRFQNLVTILRVSLKTPFATTKTVLVSRIISFVEDGIAMSQILLSKKAITDSMVLSLLHGQIHMNLLDVLISLMLTMKQNIITHSKTICDILWRCLKQTSSQEQMKFEANLKLRAATYDAFIVFMRISPNNLYVKNVMENLMKEALIDVTPANDEIYLMMPKQNGGGKSHKRKKLNVDKKFGKGRVHIANIADQQTVCTKALECLGFLIVYHGALMKPVLFFIMQEKIVSIGFLIASKAQQEGDLYRDVSCRSRLSDLVGFMMIHPVNKMPVPLNYGIAMLTKVKHSDPDAGVRENAAMNLYRAEPTIHNRKDVFYFPPEYRDLRETLMFNKQTIQKFNESSAPGDELIISLVTVNGNGAKSKDDEDIVISDNESDSVDVAAKLVEVQVTELSDEEAEPQEISDDDNEPQEISDDEPILEPVPVLAAVTESAAVPVSEPVSVSAPVPVTTRSSPRKASASDKRPPPAERKSPAKKKKVSNQNEDALVDELMADFNDELE